MNYVLKDAKKYRKIFRNLFNIYINELSGYCEWLGETMDDKGFFLPDKVKEYLEDENRASYVIYNDDRIAGFVVFLYPDNSQNENNPDCFIEEIFILNHFRGKGIAGDVVADFLEEESGTCGVCVHQENIPALRFWTDTLEKLGFEYEKIDSGEIIFLGIYL